MVELMKIMATSFKRSHACTAPLSAPNPAAGHTDACLCQRLLDPHGQVWVSILWGHCSFLLGPGAYKILFVPSQSLFSQSCISSGSSVVRLMAISSKSIYAIPRSTAPRAPAPAEVHCWTCTSSGGTQTQFCLSLCRVSGPLCPLSISGGYGV